MTSRKLRMNDSDSFESTLRTPWLKHLNYVSYIRSMVKGYSDLNCDLSRSSKYG